VQCEKPYARVKVKSELSRPLAYSLLDEAFQEKRIGLKESRGAEAVIYPYDRCFDQPRRKARRRWLKGDARASRSHLDLWRDVWPALASRGFKRRSQSSETFVKGGRKNGAGRYVADFVRACAVEANRQRARRVLPSHRGDLDLSARAVAELVSLANLNLVGPVYSTYAPERVLDKAGFCFNLGRVAEVLKLAPATLAVVGAGRLSPESGRRENLFDDGASEPLLSLDYADAQPLAWGRSGYEYSQPAVTGDGFASVSEPLRRHFNRIACFQLDTAHTFTLAGRRQGREREISNLKSHM
jgi:hypothetical protein